VVRKSLEPGRLAFELGADGALGGFREPSSCAATAARSVGQAPVACEEEVWFPESSTRICLPEHAAALALLDNKETVCLLVVYKVGSKQ
jgi:hypothetical protein